MDQKSQKHGLCGAPAGLSARDRHPTWWSFSNKSMKFSWSETVPFGMYTTTLPRDGRQREKTFPTLSLPDLSLPNLVSRNPPGGIYRGEGQCSSDWAASTRLPFSRLSFSKFQFFDKHVFYSKLLEKCICDVPVAFWALLRHSLRKIILPKGFLKGIGAPKRARS